MQLYLLNVTETNYHYSGPVLHLHFGLLENPKKVICVDEYASNPSYGKNLKNPYYNDIKNFLINNNIKPLKGYISKGSINNDILNNSKDIDYQNLFELLSKNNSKRIEDLNKNLNFLTLESSKYRVKSILKKPTFKDERKNLQPNDIVYWKQVNFVSNDHMLIYKNDEFICPTNIKGILALTNTFELVKLETDDSNNFNINKSDIF